MSARHHSSEREQLDLFRALPGDLALRDAQDLMAYPFFALGKSKRVAPIDFKTGSIVIRVEAVPEHGMATIWDADVLIWATSQIVEAENHGLRTSRFFRFTPYQLLRGIGRDTGNRQYQLLKASLARLQSTVVATTIRNGVHWRRRQFSWINEWEEMTTHDGRVEGMEFVLPEWFYNGVVDRSLVLTIDPDYFRLTGGIERWLYRVARKHAGRQAHGWLFEVAHLHEKSGSLARISDFALDLRRIAVRQPLPGYRLDILREGRRELLQIRPIEQFTVPVDKAVEAIGTSGANGIGTSGATLSAHQAHGPQLNLWPETRNPAANLESNQESNSLSLTRAGASHGASAAGRSRRVP